MNYRFLSNRWFQARLGLVIVGWIPLCGIVLLWALGLWPDPDPNPIGPGLLFFFPAWAAIFCLVIGIAQARRK